MEDNTTHIVREVLEGLNSDCIKDGSLGEPLGYEQCDDDLKDCCSIKGKLYIMMTQQQLDDLNNSVVHVDVYGANPEKEIVGVVKVLFGDGETVTSTCYEPDKFNPRLGVALCILKHAVGGTATFYRILRHGVKAYDKQVKEAEERLEEERREQRRYNKRVREKERRDERRAKREKKQKKKERKNRINELAKAIAKSKTITKYQKKVQKHQDEEGE